MPVGPLVFTLRKAKTKGRFKLTRQTKGLLGKAEEASDYENRVEKTKFPSLTIFSQVI